MTEKSVNISEPLDFGPLECFSCSNDVPVAVSFPYYILNYCGKFRIFIRVYLVHLFVPHCA